MFTVKKNINNNDNAESVLGYKFKPKGYKDQEALDFINYLQDNGKIDTQQRQAVLAEYSISRQPIGVLLVRNGFITHNKYIEAVLDHNPNAIMNEESVDELIEYTELIRTGTMIIAETRDRLFLSTLADEDVVRSIFIDNGISKEIVFLTASVAKIDAYMNRIKSIIYGNENFLDEILRKSMRLKASDIHIEPKDDSYSIFFRIDGVTTLIREGALTEYSTLVARIKDKSRIDLAEKRKPQDGGFNFDNNGKVIDLRVATIPLVNRMEKVVIRLLDPDRVPASLDLLGISDVSEWRKGVSRPDGIALICGPTGSGKTTTLQASIREMDRFGRAIYTIEDPVEYRIPYISQVNANYSVGLDFSRGIKAFMRADPDIMMLGEIRDEETARNAVKGAETGHLVVGTLHTNNIRSTLDRLKYIGVDKTEFRYILRTILVQRLMRKLCTECHGKGCFDCNQMGYSGRTVVSECAYFSNDEDVDRMIAGEIFWKTMIEDAVDKVRNGVTDDREVIKTFGEEGREHLEKNGLLSDETRKEIDG